MLPDPVCPVCGSPMTYEPRAETEVLMFYPVLDDGTPSVTVSEVKRTLPFLACSGCEVVTDGVVHGLDTPPYGYVGTSLTGTVRER